ncbi:uncharacterized protein Ecym_5073 [Eremothecium cymbalariae DBVPG|uniref:Uncharacterized protein n=1 Tax=Eremothecium cymbalariae (strain CBS 270.75 / DBVPG 7215 / KCTC 17166 / NRRL Y-17582) TaxID=931890 RepID=I6NCS1_ERECY|nr:hypothetical protein Ecym_5073 [Eremothecium cymbalariae DBVPG\
MSRIIVQLSDLNTFIADLTDSNELTLVRMFAQYQGTTAPVSGCMSPVIAFRTIPDFDLQQENDRLHEFALDEKCYQEEFIDRSPPQKGEILDIHCGIQSGQTEIIHLKRITLKDLNRLRDFMSTEVGKDFARFTGI